MGAEGPRELRGLVVNERAVEPLAMPSCGGAASGAAIKVCAASGGLHQGLIFICAPGHRLGGYDSIRSNPQRPRGSAGQARSGGHAVWTSLQVKGGGNGVTYLVRPSQRLFRQFPVRVLIGINGTDRHALGENSSGVIVPCHTAF